MKAPFPYFGGKWSVAEVVWAALGQPKHYIEPFFGSGAVLLNRPDHDPTMHLETVCDADGYVANAWRAMQADPDATAKVCDWPVNHADLSARKRKLLAEGASLLERLTADDEYYDVKLAGYWIWAASCWIGSGLTSPGARPHVGKSGMGVHAIGQRPHPADEATRDVRDPYNTNIYAWFRKLSDRLRNVRVVCGDWSRVCGGDWQDNVGVCGIFFDPPYSVTDRDDRCYGDTDSLEVAGKVRTWCLERGDRPTHRIVYAGYDTEGDELTAAGWWEHVWSASGGYGKISRNGDSTRGLDNRHRERLWFSPHCVASAVEPMLFEVKCS